MEKKAIKNILVIGVDATMLAISAKDAGYNVYAADYFGDRDLKRVSKDSQSIIAQKAGRSTGRLATDYSPCALLDLARELEKKYRQDAALLASGLEDSPYVLTELNDLVPILGNNPKTVEKVRNRKGFFRQLKKLGIKHPKSIWVRDFSTGKRAARDIGYPILIKPLPSLGGHGIRKVRNESEFKKIFHQVISSSPQGVLIQEFVFGTNASVSFLSSKKDALVLTLNEQLLGIRKLGQTESFGYCGNIVPAFTSTTLVDTCEDIIDKIASCFNLVGSNGVDLVVSEEDTPYVVEVNPRFQGSLECVEKVTGINLVDAHIRACLDGTLPSLKRKVRKHSVRLVLYARQNLVAPDLVNFEDVRDIPLPGVIVEEGEPFCSVVVEEKTRTSALAKAMTRAAQIYAMAERKFNGHN